jgi:hypothetical protein
VNGRLAQVGEDGENTSVVVWCRGQAQLGEDAADVLDDRCLCNHEATGDGSVGASLGHQAEDLAFAGEPLQRLPVTLAGQELPDDLGVDDHVAGGDPLEVVDEAQDVRDAVFEQVADAGAIAFEQLIGVARLDVLGDLPARLALRVHPMQAARTPEE